MRNELIYATGYRRTRHGQQQLELRCDGIAGCLRTPEGGSSKQYLVVKDGKSTHARLLTVREAARLMGAPDTLSCREVIMTVISNGRCGGYASSSIYWRTILTKIAEAIYSD